MHKPMIVATKSLAPISSSSRFLIKLVTKTARFPRLVILTCGKLEELPLISLIMPLISISTSATQNNHPNQTTSCVMKNCFMFQIHTHIQMFSVKH